MKLLRDNDVVRERSLTIDEFCELEGFARNSYYKLRRAGYGPEETYLPGVRLVRISPEARRAWHARLAELRQGKAAQLEEERRQAQTALAGRRAAASPNHVSRRRSAR